VHTGFSIAISGILNSDKNIAVYKVSRKLPCIVGRALKHIVSQKRARDTKLLNCGRTMARLRDVNKHSNVG
jgi:hypothetical protein